MNEFETFYAEIRELGGSKDSVVLGVSIPKKVTEFGNFKVGDSVKVMIKKAE